MGWKRKREGERKSAGETRRRHHGGSVREDEAQSNGEHSLPPFAFNVPDIVSSQLASEDFDSFDGAVADVTVQDVASSGSDIL